MGLTPCPRSQGNLDTIGSSESKCQMLSLRWRVIFYPAKDRLCCAFPGSPAFLPAASPLIPTQEGRHRHSWETKDKGGQLAWSRSPRLSPGGTERTSQTLRKGLFSFLMQVLRHRENALVLTTFMSSLQKAFQPKETKLVNTVSNRFNKYR